MQWPDLKAQQRLQALQDPAELALARHRAQLLVERGYGALEGWVQPNTAPEPSTRLPGPSRAQQQALDLFDQAD